MLQYSDTERCLNFRSYFRKLMREKVVQRVGERIKLPCVLVHLYCSIRFPLQYVFHDFIILVKYYVKICQTKVLTLCETCLDTVFNINFLLNFSYRFLPYVGWVTIIMTEKPIIKVCFLGMSNIWL